MEIQNYEIRRKLHKLEIAFITAGREVLRDREIRVGDLLEDLLFSDDRRGVSSVLVFSTMLTLLC